MDHFLVLVSFLCKDVEFVILYIIYLKYLVVPYDFFLLLINLPVVDLRDNSNVSVNLMCDI